MVVLLHKKLSPFMDLCVCISKEGFCEQFARIKGGFAKVFGCPKEREEGGELWWVVKNELSHPFLAFYTRGPLANSKKWKGSLANHVGPKL